MQEKAEKTRFQCERKKRHMSSSQSIMFDTDPTGNKTKPRNRSSEWKIKPGGLKIVEHRAKEFANKWPTKWILDCPFQKTPWIMDRSQSGQERVPVRPHQAKKKCGPPMENDDWSDGLRHKKNSERWLMRLVVLFWQKWKQTSSWQKGMAI
jgi:hypothetical protein